MSARARPQATVVSVFGAGRELRIERRARDIDGPRAIEALAQALDERRGVLLSSSTEVPGRYRRWDVGFVDPPIAITARGRRFEIEACNARGELLLPLIAEGLADLSALEALEQKADRLEGAVLPVTGRFPEEERSRQPSVFSLLRRVIALFRTPSDPHLGLYGAFGYDLAFQLEPIQLRHRREPGVRDLVLYLPDELVVVDHQSQRARQLRYEFSLRGCSTDELARSGVREPSEPAACGDGDVACDHAAGEYARGVEAARAAFARGDLFEAVLSQTFKLPCRSAPSEVFRRLRSRNPSPYGFLVNLGGGEHLVGASPEMYVRVDGDRVETCPIAGTIARGSDSLSDAAQIRILLNSRKDESELTMCTDVDRNDKARICRPGTVRVIGRRQIELYSRLIHTVDHVEGRLRDEFDGLDAFLSHAWAVTVTGAPKLWAMQFIEDHERSPRGWYGGAVGQLGFDGGVSTGLTLRTIHLRAGVARVRSGATLLFDSDPEAEERETRLKAEALLDAIQHDAPVRARSGRRAETAPLPGRGRRVLLVDHQDSFVHMLADYLRLTGADVVTWRAGSAPLAQALAREAFDLSVLSPGPGRPADFAVADTVAALRARGLPILGVCLGLQGIVEHFGGELGRLPAPVHGKASQVRVLGGRLLAEVPAVFRAGRYHSWVALRECLPPDLRVTAESDDGQVMAIEHRREPIAGFQFHPESILSQADDLGLRLMRRAVTCLARTPDGGPRVRRA